MLDTILTENHIRVRRELLQDIYGEYTINLSGLSGSYMSAPAKDIYIVVEDAAGNISNPLKIAVAAYIIPTDSDDDSDSDSDSSSSVRDRNSGGSSARLTHR